MTSASKNFISSNFSIVFSLFLTYGTFNFLRKVYPSILPALQERGNVSESTLGQPITVHAMMYGFSKFFGQLASDHIPSKIFHCLSLSICGALCLFMSPDQSIPVLSVFWGLQGLIQGFGWPTLAKVLLRNVEKSKQAQYWGILSTSGNVGQMVAPFVITYLVNVFGTRQTFVFVGAGAIIMSIVCGFLLSRTQELPSSTVKHRNVKCKFTKISFNFFRSTFSRPLINAYVTNCFCYILFKICSDFGALLLHDMYDLSAVKISFLLSSIEAGGFVGSLASGFLCSLLKNNVALTLLSYLTILSATWIFFTLSTKTTPPYAVLTLITFTLGFGIHGVRSLVGLYVRHNVSESMSGLASGILEFCGQVGAGLAGVPIGYMVERVGWQSVTIICSVPGCLLVLSHTMLLSLDLKHKNTNKKTM